MIHFEFDDLSTRVRDLETFEEWICDAVNDSCYSAPTAFVEFIEAARWGC